MILPMRVTIICIMMKNKTAAAYAGMVIYAVIVGFSFLVIKNSGASSSPVQMMFFRFAAAFIPYIILLCTGVLKVSLKSMKRPSLLLTALTYVGFLGFQAFGMVYTTSIVSGILFAMVPVFARIIGGILLKEKTSAVQNIFMAVSVCSVIAMFALGSADSLVGIDVRGFLLLLASSLCCAASNVLMRYVKADFAPLQIGFFSASTGLIVFTAAAVVANTVNGSWSTFFAPLSDGGYLLYILYLGILCTIVTVNILSFSLKYLPAVNATIWGNLSTAISVVAGALILGEPLMPYQIVCAVLIIIGVLGISFSGANPARKRNI